MCAPNNLLRLSDLEAGARLDRVLADRLPDFSREYLKQLIQDGHVAINGVVVFKPAYRLTSVEEVVITLPETRPLDLQPEPIPLDVIYEDEHLLVINKPSGVLVHPVGQETTGTLVNALLYHCQGSLSGINGVERPGIVHRLDKDTSGLMLVAKTDQAHRRLQDQFKDRTATRRYRAIVQGRLPQEAGEVNAPIARNPKNREKMAVVHGGREASTHWQVVNSLGDTFSVLELSLKTGRTHQIRVHMAHIGHPVFGDALYGTGFEKVLKIDTGGQVLQASHSRFVHPASGDPMAFEIPPDEKFTRALAFCQSYISR